jgi:hypothetical protein
MYSALSAERRGSDKMKAAAMARIMVGEGRAMRQEE